MAANMTHSTFLSITSFSISFSPPWFHLHLLSHSSNFPHILCSYLLLCVSSFSPLTFWSVLFMVFLFLLLFSWCDSFLSFYLETRLLSSFSHNAPHCPVVHSQVYPHNEILISPKNICVIWCKSNSSARHFLFSQQYVKRQDFLFSGQTMYCTTRSGSSDQKIKIVDVSCWNLFDKGWEVLTFGKDLE